MRSLRTEPLQQLCTEMPRSFVRCRVSPHPWYGAPQGAWDVPYQCCKSGTGREDGDMESLFSFSHTMCQPASLESSLLIRIHCQLLPGEASRGWSTLCVSDARFLPWGSALFLPLHHQNKREGHTPAQGYRCVIKGRVTEMGSERHWLAELNPRSAPFWQWNYTFW